MASTARGPASRAHGSTWKLEPDRAGAAWARRQTAGSWQSVERDPNFEPTHQRRANALPRSRDLVSNSVRRTA